MIQKYPGKRYRADGATCYVQSAEEDARLGPEWADSPKKCPPLEPKRSGKKKADAE